MRQRFSGVLPIVPAPFDAEGQVDLASLRRLVEFAVTRGAGAVVFPGVASEDIYLAADERRAALKAVVEHAAGRLPVIAGTNAAQPETMVAYAAEAAELGAAGLMAMAIPEMGDNPGDWFARISDAGGGRPIILQNVFAPRGANLSSDQMCQLARDVPSILYVKEEGIPSGPKVSALVAHAGTEFDGVIGGGGARYLLEELDRGVVATMPAIELLELHVQMFRAFAAGQRKRAVELYERSLALLLIQAPYRMRMTKLIMKHRGIISTDIVREPLPEMDDVLRRLTIELYERAMQFMEEAVVA